MMRRFKQEVSTVMQCRQRPCAQPLHQLGRDLDIRTVRYLQRNLRYLQGLPEIHNGLLDPLYGIFKQPRIDMGVQIVVVMPSSTARRAMTSAVFRSRAPSSIPGSMWQCMSIISSVAGGVSDGRKRPISRTCQLNSPKEYYACISLRVNFEP